MLAFVMKAGLALCVNSIHVRTWGKLALDGAHVLLAVTPMQNVYVTLDSPAMTANLAVMTNVLEIIPMAVPQILMTFKDMVAMEMEIATNFVRERIFLLVDSAHTNREKLKSACVEGTMTASEVFHAILMEVAPLRSSCLTLQPVIQFLMVFVKVELVSVVEHQHPCPQQSQQLLLHLPRIQFHTAVVIHAPNKYGI